MGRVELRVVVDAPDAEAARAEVGGTLRSWLPDSTDPDAPQVELVSCEVPASDEFALVLQTRRGTSALVVGPFDDEDSAAAFFVKDAASAYHTFEVLPILTASAYKEQAQ